MFDDTDMLIRLSVGIALAGVVSLVLLMFGVQAVGPFALGNPPPLMLALGALNAVMVPLVVLGVGMGGIALLRGSEDRRALIGVLGGGAYLFMLSTLLALAVSG